MSFRQLSYGPNTTCPPFCVRRVPPVSEHLVTFPFAPLPGLTLHTVVSVSVSFLQPATSRVPYSCSSTGCVALFNEEFLPVLGGPDLFICVSLSPIFSETRTQTKVRKIQLE